MGFIPLTAQPSDGVFRVLPVSSLDLSTFCQMRLKHFHLHPLYLPPSLPRHLRIASLHYLSEHWSCIRMKFVTDKVRHAFCFLHPTDGIIIGDYAYGTSSESGMAHWINVCCNFHQRPVE